MSPVWRTEPKVPVCNHVLTGIDKANLEQMHSWVLEQGFQYVPVGSWAPSSRLFDEFKHFYWYALVGKSGLIRIYLHKREAISIPQEGLAFIDLGFGLCNAADTLEQLRGVLEHAGFQVKEHN